MRDPKERIRDILEAIANIERYAAQGRSAFDRDELIRSWCVRQLEILGEAVRAIPPVVRELDPTVPWSQITGMRNILAHGYFDVDGDLVWNVIQEHLPRLKDQMERLLRVIEGHDQK